MLMETKNEKDLRVYVQPETEVIELNAEGIMAGMESGGSGGEIGG